MTDLRKAAQQALEALTLSIPKPRPADDDYAELGWKEHNAAITALRAALAEPVQEPVAWLRVIDEALVTHHVGVADPTDDYATAREKMNALLCEAESIGAYFAELRKGDD